MKETNQHNHTMLSPSAYVVLSNVVITIIGTLKRNNRSNERSVRYFAAFKAIHLNIDNRHQSFLMKSVISRSIHLIYMMNNDALCQMTNRGYGVTMTVMKIKFNVQANNLNAMIHNYSAQYTHTHSVRNNSLYT